MSSEKPSFRAIIAGLVGMPPVIIYGREYTGDYLASLVSLNPRDIEGETSATPQLQSELGRIVARAKRQKDEAELDYRVWRDGLVHRLCNSVPDALAAGFECALPTTVKGKKGEPDEEKPGKTPSAAEVERYLRTLPEYRQHWAVQIAAEEAWTAVHAAFTAAENRTWALRAWTQAGGRDVGPGRVEEPVPGADYEPATPPPVPAPGEKKPTPPPPGKPGERSGDNPPGMTEGGKRRPPPPPPPIPPKT